MTTFDISAALIVQFSGKMVKNAGPEGCTLNSDFRQSMAKPVIRLEDVSALRAHIELRHPDFDSHMRAEMMADDINRMLDVAMTGLDGVYRESIKKKLITEQLIGNRQSILKLDVLNRILALDIKPDQLMAKTWGWYVLNTGQSITLSDFMEQASPYLPHRVRDAIKDTAQRNLAYQSAGRPPVLIDEAESDTPSILPEPELKDPSVLILRFDAFKNSIRARFKRTMAYRLTRKGQIAICVAVCFIALGAMLPQIINAIPERQQASGKAPSTFTPPLEYRVTLPGYGAALVQLEKPTYLRYQNISIEKLKTYLDRKSSMLLTKDYLDQLMSYSYEKDLNPLLLIAIIGQEQNYVPSQHKFAPRMIENPFNIYGSWETHPVGFTASMKEACYTINTALVSRTMYVDPFAVINTRYAEDPRWYLGVKVIFRDLMAVAGE